MEIKNQHRWKVAEVELVYKTTVKASEQPKITCSKDAADVFRTSWNGSTIALFEEFKVMLTNRANCVLGIFHLFKGGIAGTVADPKLIFACAIKAGACGIIVAHNHPSRNLSPSQSDIDLTKKLKEGAKFLEIQMLDHIILTPEKYFSFGDERLL